MFLYTAEIVSQVRDLLKVIRAKTGLKILLSTKDLNDFRNIVPILPRLSENLWTLIHHGYPTDIVCHISKDDRIPQGYALSYYEYSEEVSNLLDNCKAGESLYQTYFSKNISFMKLDVLSDVVSVILKGKQWTVERLPNQLAH